MIIKKDIECKLDLPVSTKGYFLCLRELLSDLESLNNEKINELFKKYEVSFVEIDDIPRVGLNFPNDEKKERI